MTETKATYIVAQCPVCKTPVTTATGEDGTVYTRALYSSDRERQQVYSALLDERAEVVRLRGELDKGRDERIKLRIAAINARKWAARWKRAAGAGHRDANALREALSEEAV